MASAPAVAPDAPPVGAGARLALVVLVALVVLSPWATGSVDPPFVRAITVISLATSLLALALDARAGMRPQAPIPLWPIAGLWLLGALQLVPLPAWLLHAIAPGPASVWYPSSPEAATVLGSGPRPISLHPEATRRSLALATGIVALAFAAVPAMRQRRLLLRATVAIVTGGVAVALYALVARLVFGNKLYGIWSVPTVAPFGPFVNKNDFAGYVELVALLAVGLASGLASEARRATGWLSWIESRRAWRVVLAWGCALILILAVPVSLSRGGVLSLTVGLAVFTGLKIWTRWMARPSWRRTVAVAVIAASLLVAFVNVLPTEARDRVLTLTGVTTEESGAYRLAVWRDSLRLIGSSPLIGSGFGAFEDALRRFRTRAGHVAVQHAENDYLETIAESGLLGLLLAALLVTLVLTRGLRAATNAPQPLGRSIATGAVAALVTLALHSLFDFNLRIPSNAIVAAALVALALALDPDQVSELARPRIWAVVGALAASLIAILATQAVPSRLERGLLWRSARTAETSLRRATLEAATVAHLRCRPTDSLAWLALAWLRLSAWETEASPLAAWAVVLDPSNASVRAARARLGPK